MSMSKRILFDNDPKHDEIRAEIRRRNSEFIEQFQYRVPDTKFKIKDGKRRKDAFWGYALSTALKEVTVEFVTVNGGVFFMSEQERDIVLKRALNIYEAPHPLKRHC